MKCYGVYYTVSNSKKGLILQAESLLHVTPYNKTYM